MKVQNLYFSTLYLIVFRHLSKQCYIEYHSIAEIFSFHLIFIMSNLIDKQPRYWRKCTARATCGLNHHCLPLMYMIFFLNRLTACIRMIKRTHEANINPPVNNANSVMNALILSGLQPLRCSVYVCTET